MMSAKESPMAVDSTDDPFSMFGLPVSFAVDAAALEKAFLARARAAHPDFHASDAATQEKAVEETSRLNEAYAILKTPIRRAEYLLDRLGGPSGAEVRDMPPEFLMEIMDIREEIEEVRSAGGLESDCGRALEAKLTNDLGDVYEEMETRFASALAAETPDADVLLGLRRSINVARYLEGLLRDLKA
jgi:molecular chaperone HscB